ncbi:leucine-rich repeat-containing protein 72-like isoform X1 [Ruditapes philippinarum]|uniref:leucine-rich repeat-containing protein 72-like isoform X1 n=1 Tax=Ruditapes philippinarum TaxID=129788 RepID=UPI00295A9652|nr:leucine-rich repeat-containing protein 72-like isoform X1 [Ruditapes philippinarum]
MAASAKVLEAHLKERGIKKDKDVEELYLAKQNLSECVELTRFKYLRSLWLNKNRLRDISCLDNNFQLAELYLQNNQLTDIAGVLQHLTSLKVLMLHNNQLTKLDKVVKEFNKMQCLKILNLFNNPVAQEPDYRLYVIHSVPSVELLDRQEVLKSEKEAGKKIYEQEQEKIRETVAFGRRSEGPPNLYYPGKDQPLTKFDTRDLGNSFLRDSPLYMSSDDACNARRLKKSVTLYTTFDWSKVPRIEERRQTDTVFDSPEIITHVYR